MAYLYVVALPRGKKQVFLSWRLLASGAPMLALWTAVVALLLTAFGAAAQTPVYYERDGLVVVEAEDFVEQRSDQLRRWYVINASNDGYASDQIKPATPPLPDLPEPDGDGTHAHLAGGGTYIEILPDTRRTHDDRLNSTNFSNLPGHLAIISYAVHFATPGRYYVWVRAYSTGTEDNGVHVGLNGEWPASGQRLQWCNGKHTWDRESKQRTEANHCGEAGKIFLDVETAGPHTVQFSMREDGFEMDQWLMTTDPAMARPLVGQSLDAAPYQEAPSTAVEADTWGAVKEKRQPR